MALMKKIALKDKYVQVPNETAQASQNALSLQAVGLIVNLWSYDTESWELHKTELYKRFIKNKETSVRNAWDELVAANYIIEFKYRVGKRWEYEYFYRIKPFSDEEKNDLLAQSVEITGVSSTLDFQDLKMKTSKCTPQNQDISNKKKSNTNKQNTNKQNKKIVNNAFTRFEMFEIMLVLHQQYSPGRWSKSEFMSIANRLLDELMDDDDMFRKSDYPLQYIDGCFKNIAHHHDKKTGDKSFEYDGTEIPWFDWMKQ